MIARDNVAKQHRLLMCRMTLETRKRRITKAEPRIKWWKMKKEDCCEEFREEIRRALGGEEELPDDWTDGSASLMFVVNRVPNCRAVIRNRIYGFMKRLVSSSNALVLSTVTSDARFRSRIVRHWLKSLYIHFDAG